MEWWKLLPLVLLTISCRFEALARSNFLLEVNCSTNATCNAIIATILQNLSSEFAEAGQTPNLTGILHIPDIEIRDFDECTEHFRYCPPNTHCTNSFLSYACECLQGFQNQMFNGSSVSCSDVDECMDSTKNNCSTDEQCVNDIGSFRCLKCNMTNNNGSCPDATSSSILTEVTTATEPTLEAITTITETKTLPLTTDYEVFSTSTEKSTTIVPTAQESVATQSSEAITPIQSVFTASLPIVETTSFNEIPTTQIISTTELIALTTSSTFTHSSITTNPDMTNEVSDFSSVSSSTSLSNAKSTLTSTEQSSLPRTNTRISYSFSSTTTNEPNASTTMFTSELIAAVGNGLLRPGSTKEPKDYQVKSTAMLDTTITPPIQPNNSEQIQMYLNSIEDEITAGPVSEDRAMAILEDFGMLASPNEEFDRELGPQITQLVERLLNTMTLENGMFVFRSGNITGAARDYNQSTNLQYSVKGGFNSTFSPSIILPSVIFSAGVEQRISFASYDTAYLFHSTQVSTITSEQFNFDQVTEGLVINSEVIGSAVNGTEVQDLSSAVIIRLSTIVKNIPKISHNNQTVVRRSLYNPRCVFFDYTLQNGTGDWSEEGCTLAGSLDDGDIQCNCDHLTSFAVLMSVETRIDDNVLTILTYVGCALSIFGLLVSIITYSVFKHLRKHKSKHILLHFCLALMGVYIVYTFGVTAALPKNQSECIASGFFIHFFTSATFAWMLIEVLDMYLLFVKVWSDVGNPIKKACLIGWGFPLLLSVVTLAVHFGLQSSMGEDAPRLYPLYRETVTCWLAPLGLYWAFFLPMGIMLAVNLVLFFIVLYHVTCRRATSKLTRVQGNSKMIKARHHIMNAVAIMLLTGPTWVIGFFINLDPLPDGPIRRILAYIFVVLNAFQGLWIFIVFTVRPKAVRLAWINLLTGNGKLYHGTKNGSTSGGRPYTKTSSTYLSRGNRRKSSVDTRRSSASSGLSGMRVYNSRALRHLDADNAVNCSDVNVKQYRYRAESDDAHSIPSSHSSTIRKNDLLENQTSADNLVFNKDESSSVSSD